MTEYVYNERTGEFEKAPGAPPPPGGDPPSGNWKKWLKVAIPAVSVTIAVLTGLPILDHDSIF